MVGKKEHSWPHDMAHGSKMFQDVPRLFDPGSQVPSRRMARGNQEAKRKGRTAARSSRLAGRGDRIAVDEG